MATERQIAANRRNARSSTGPTTTAGKRRSSRNALRHGLSSCLAVSGSADVEALVHLLIGRDAESDLGEIARDAARAHLNLVRVREVKADVFDRIYQFGVLKPAPRSRPLAEIRYVLRRLDEPCVRLPATETMPDDEEERAAEAIRRLLPELRKLDRYEKRAFSAKQTALRKLADCRRELSAAAT